MTRKYPEKHETIGINVHKVNGSDRNKTSITDSVNSKTDTSHFNRETVSEESTPITLTIYSDKEETPKVSYVKPELKDKNKNFEEEKKNKVTYNIQIEQHSSIDVSEPKYNTNNVNDVELSLTPAVFNPTTTPMEQLEVETSLKFTEKTFPVDSFGKIVYTCKSVYKQK